MKITDYHGQEHLYTFAYSGGELDAFEIWRYNCRKIGRVGEHMAMKPVKRKGQQNGQPEEDVFRTDNSNERNIEGSLVNVIKICIIHSSIAEDHLRDEQKIKTTFRSIVNVNIKVN